MEDQSEAGPGDTNKFHEQVAQATMVPYYGLNCVLPKFMC